MLVPVLLTVLVCVGGWLYGEFYNNQPLRIICAIACVIVFSGIAAVASGIQTALITGIPMTTAVHEYLDATQIQLQAGNSEFVIDEFNGFKERAHITYETGGFLDAIESETSRMTTGPNVR